MTSDHGGSEFAVLIRRRRLAARLTQRELAAQAGVSVRTIRDAERGRTARPQRHTVELLATALGLSGRERSEFLTAARGERPGAGRGGEPSAGEAGRSGTGFPLPPAVPLIGRDGEVVRLAGHLTGSAAGPLVLVGLAGVGKSVLALAVAHRVAERFPGGVAGIVVSEGCEVRDLLDALAAALGVARYHDLAGWLAGRSALLFVDAVERAPDRVREALDRLPPSLRVIATGRGPVGHPEERVWPVAPLELPPVDVGVSWSDRSVPRQLAELARYPAAALFLDRLGRVRAEPLAADEVPAMVGLVRRLGGLPLALELAAAHGRLLRLPEILRRYGDRVLDLGSGEVVSLRDAVAGSYRLLTPVERLTLHRLAVFRNRWSVELAEELLDGSPVAGDPVPVLDRLVSLGLAGVRGTREHRFRLLDVVRDFATEQAEASGELTQARRAHARVMARLAARTAPALAGPGLPAAVARLDDLAADLWAALNHAANDDPHTALCLAAKLPRWWRFRGRDVAGRQWLRRLLDDPRTADADPVVRAWAAVGAAQLAQEHGRGPEELPGVEAALAAFRRSGDVTGELAARTVLHSLWVTNGGYDQARRHTEAALALAVRAGRLRDATVAQINLTWHEIRVGDLGAADRRLAAVDRLAAECGEHRLRVLAAANRAEVARLDGRYDEAVAVGRRVLHRLGDLGDPSHRQRVLGTVGLALAQAGRAGEAEQVLTELRATPAAGGGTTEGVRAAIEARLALVRGDRAGAAEWFAAAARAYEDGHDRRDVLESLVGMAASTEEPAARAAALARMEEVSRGGAFTLVPRERALLERLLPEGTFGKPAGAGGAPLVAPSDSPPAPRSPSEPPGDES